MNDFGRRMADAIEKSEASGEKRMTLEEINRELSRRRGGIWSAEEDFDRSREYFPDDLHLHRVGGATNNPSELKPRDMTVPPLRVCPDRIRNPQNDVVPGGFFVPAVHANFAVDLSEWHDLYATDRSRRAGG